MNRIFSIRILNNEVGYTKEENLTNELYSIMTKLSDMGYSSKLLDIFQNFVRDNGGVDGRVYCFDSRDMKEITNKINSLYNSKYKNNVHNNVLVFNSVVEAVNELYSDKNNYIIFFGESLVESGIDKLVDIRVTDFGKRLANLEHKYVKYKNDEKQFKDLFYDFIRMIETGFVDYFTYRYKFYFFLRYGITASDKSLKFVGLNNLKEFLKFSNFKSLDDMFKMYVFKKTGELISYMTEVTGDLS